MSLFWLSVLGVIVLFIYAVISFAFLQNNYVETDDAALYCANLGQCMYSVLRYGLTDNLGILIPFERDGSAPNFTAGVFIARLIFDISFFIIVTTIGLNIVFGIIVDTFTELREERNKIETDQKSKCFICDVPSYDFDRRAKGFSKHIKNDHNMWNYVYYSLYLDSIDIGDHNAIQKYVYELMLENNTRFFPQEEARCLINEEDSVDKIDELEEKVEEILRYFREKEHKKSLSVKRQEQNKWEEEVLKGQSSSYTTS
ncbi:PREDICTED: inositol 1,4,5-trisphosphate receptor type 2-like [Amphimedon queenslandica]|nr:PREDICTED: inositol 1,4,5-trisphosphate receptor type 2-like [Amphimedon queenslandica]|eukprot:XP_019861654.1 PREDICTED: inositol 1,4,5-trisphosphate receptor type 2-like [Amphimedon queenslandica]